MNNYPFQAKLAAANDNWNINLTLNLTRAKNVVIFSLFKYFGELNYLFRPKTNDERKGFVALSPSYYPTIPLHNYRRKSHRSKMTTTDIIPVSQGTDIIPVTTTDINFNCGNGVKVQTCEFLSIQCVAAKSSGRPSFDNPNFLDWSLPRKLEISTVGTKDADSESGNMPSTHFSHDNHSLVSHPNLLKAESKIRFTPSFFNLLYWRFSLISFWLLSLIFFFFYVSFLLLADISLFSLNSSEPSEWPARC